MDFTEPMLSKEIALSTSVFETLMVNYDGGGMVKKLVILLRNGYRDPIKWHPYGLDQSAR